MVNVSEFELISTYANPSLGADLWTWETQTHFGFHSNMNGCPYYVIGVAYLNHDEKDCKTWTDSGGTLNKEEQQYGPWLQANITNIQ